MKKLFKSFFALAAVALMASCSNDEPVAPNEGEISDGDTRYITVNICSPIDMSRDDLPGTYEYGEDAENAVSKVRFFFFKADGSAATVNSNKDNSWDGEILESTPNTTPGNINNIVQCNIVINTEEGDVLPSSMVAVANYGDWLGTKYNTVDALRTALISDAFANTYKTRQAANAGIFVMANSVYDKGGDLEFATPIAGENICRTEDEALDNPVDIYVERVVAKVRVVLSDEFATGATKAGAYHLIVPAKDKDGNAIKDANNNEIYIGLLGWSVTGTTQNVQLGKNIGSSQGTGAWTNSSIMGASIPWNVDAFYRCYWETNAWANVAPIDAATRPYGLNYTKWSESATVTAFGKKSDDKDFGSLNYTYVYPNAATEADGSRDASYVTNAITAAGNITNSYDNGRTQVIFKAQLLTKNGSTYTPAEFASWLGTTYTLEDLKTAFAGYVSRAIYYSDDNGHTLNSIEPSMLTLNNVAGGAQIGTKTETRRYAVYAQVDPTKYALHRWYDGDGVEYADMAAVNAVLAATEPAKAWANGDTYFYTDIKHLGAEDSKAEYGVVRNHVYQVAINGITGLGTPVYKPNQIIIPEETEDLFGYVAANINVLSWRIVNQNVVLGQ